jgi:chromate transporter
MGGSVLDNALMDEPSPTAPSLGQIASVFTRYANTTFGGGSATIAVLREQIVERRRWLSQLQFDLSYALSRLTPGTNLLAFCTAAGWIARRWTGALVALLAASIPCSLLVVVVTHFYEAWQHNRIVMAALRGALAAAVAITIATAWNFAQPHVKAATLKAVVIVPVALLLALRFAISPMRILLLAAVVGLLWPATEKKA